MLWKRIIAFSPFLLLLIILTAGWWLTPQVVNEVPLCFWKWKFHVDCPGCGLTRSFLVMAKGQLFEAFRYNAAGPLVYFFFLVYAVENGIRWVKPAWRLDYPVLFAQVYGMSVFILLFGHWVIRVWHQKDLFFG